MNSRPYEKTQKIICAAGLALLGAAFALWAAKKTPPAAELCAALVCLVLFAAVCLRFVHAWFELWFSPRAEREEERGIPMPGLFLIGLLCAGAYVTASELILHYVNPNMTPEQALDFWKAADAYHYLCIARDWYLSEGSTDRLVQLVFLPMYPIAVRAVSFVVGNYVVSGMLVSALSFAGALCVLYKLVLMDYGAAAARRAAIFLCIVPGAFFFAAPMSESLFILLCALSVYSARRGRWLSAGLLGALAAFTRSLGLILAVPLAFEMAGDILHGDRRAWRGAAAVLMVPLGFAAYCLVNYSVSGDAFKFLEYQREHWHQSLGLFFDTAAYQTRYAITAARSGSSNFYGLWLPNIAAVFGAPIALLLSSGKLRASYTAWAIAYYAVAVGATWLLSAPRYMAALLPLHISLAVAAEDRRLRVMLYAVSAICGGLYLAAFVLRLNVW